jgi:hypothetical protein
MPLNQNPSDMTPEDHIATGDLLLRWAQAKSGTQVPHVGERRLREAAQAQAHYAAATAKLALIAFERDVKPVEMVFTAKRSADGKALEIDHTIPPHTYPTA